MRQWSEESYVRAYRFAADAHRGQKIPGAAKPYIVHPAMVAMEIITVLSGEPGWDADLSIQCALLHDVLEDTGVDADSLETAFGKAVRSGVEALSHDAQIGDRRQRVLDCIGRIQASPWEIWMVKLADRIVNLLRPPPPDWSDAKIADYAEESHIIHQRLGKANPFLSRRLKLRIAAYPPTKPIRPGLRNGRDSA